jgi:hypothetical protein
MTSDRKEARVRQLIPYFSGGVLVVVIAIIMTAAGRSPQSQDSPAAGSSASTSPMSAQERCAVEVMGLLDQSLQGVQQGYAGGLNADQVASQYGTESDVFKAFTYSQSEMIGDVMAHGAGGALTRIRSRVCQQCAEWGQR